MTPEEVKALALTIVPGDRWRTRGGFEMQTVTIIRCWPELHVPAVLVVGPNTSRTMSVKHLQRRYRKVPS